MFGLFSRSKAKAGKFDFSQIGTDMHSHLLPGIDDGAKDVAASVEYIRGMNQLGYKKFITTPHIMWDMYRNTPVVIQQRLEIVKEELRKENIDVEISAAAEYFLDEHVSDLLQKKEKLLTISGNKVLVEFSMAFPSMNIKDILFEMQMQGYQPIIAHPERYIYLQKNKEFYNELKDIGCMFQLNILSITGHYGKSVNELAQYLIKHDFYDLLGTDLHHHGHLDGLENFQAGPVLAQLIDTGRIINQQL